MPYIKISDEQLDKAVKAVLDSNHTLKQAVQTNLLLEKALDKACELIAEAVNQDCTIFDEFLESPYLYRTEAREWKEWLLND